MIKKKPAAKAKAPVKRTKSSAGKAVKPAAKKLAAKKTAARKAKPVTSKSKLTQSSKKPLARPAKRPETQQPKAPQSPAERNAIVAAEAAYDKKALDVVVLDLKEASPIADLMVLASGRSETHLRSIMDNVELKMKEHGQRVLHREGYREGRWIVVDFGDVLVNGFLDNQRAYYGLEKLYSNARVVARYEA